MFLSFHLQWRGCIPLSPAKVHKKDEFCNKRRKEKSENFHFFLRNIESLPLIRNAKIHLILPDRKHSLLKRKLHMDAPTSPAKEASLYLLLASFNLFSF